MHAVSRPSRRTLCQLILAVMALLQVWLALAGALSVSHQPGTEAGADHAVSALSSSEHAHDHDDDVDAASSIGELHSHHAPDHSHDPGNLPPEGVNARLFAPATWQAALLWAPCHGPCATPDKPPQA